MDKLFEAVRHQHPGFEVLDVKLLANQQEVADQDAAELDDAFAASVTAATGPLPIADFA